MQVVGHRISDGGLLQWKREMKRKWWRNSLAIRCLHRCLHRCCPIYDQPSPGKHETFVAWSKLAKHGFTKNCLARTHGHHRLFMECWSKAVGAKKLQGSSANSPKPQRARALNPCAKPSLPPSSRDGPHSLLMPPSPPLPQACYAINQSIKPACTWAAHLGAGDRWEPTSYVQNFSNSKDRATSDCKVHVCRIGRILRQYLPIIHLQKSHEGWNFGSPVLSRTSSCMMSIRHPPRYPLDAPIMWDWS